MFAEIEGADDAPDLVLLHGGIGTGRYHWSKLVAALAQRYRVHLPDLPGHGKTPVPEGVAYSRELLVAAVAGYLDALGPPVHVAGFSMGGHTCLALAQDRPDVFASLTLIGVSVREHEGLHGWRNHFDPDVLAERYPLWARHLSKIHAPLGGPDAWRDVCIRDSKGLRIDVDVDALRGVQCRVLLVRGDRDQAVDPAHYAELRTCWPQADEFVVPAGGHDVQLTRSALVQAPLLDFLERAAS
jgi:3-oxoadipate enol-lactonase